jgi:hypothetical protein
MDQELGLPFGELPDCFGALDGIADRIGESEVSADRAGVRERLEPRLQSARERS